MSVPITINDMTQKQQAVLGMAYKLADALQMDLQLHDRKDKFSLSGTATYDLPVVGEFTIPLNARVWASSVSKKEAGILVRIKGRLWAYLVYMADAKELHFCLIDAEKCNLRETTAASYSGLFSASMLKKIGAESGPPAALCSRRAVCASATPPSNPRVKSEGVGQPGLPYW